MKKSQILMDKLMDISTRHELNEVVNSLKEIQDEEYRITVAFLGEFNTGKSTLINALMGKKLLPAFDEPTTAVITQVLYGNEDRYIAVEKSDEGEEKEVPIEAYDLASEIVNTEKNDRVIVRKKDIGFLDESTVIIDTPGLSSLNETHTKITYGYLPMADIGIIVMNASKGTAPDSVMEFLKKYPKEMLTEFYFIVNRIDAKLDKSLDRIKLSFHEALSQLVENPKIIMTSGLKALDCRISGNTQGYRKWGVSELERIIKEEVPRLKKKVLEKRKVERLKVISNRVVKLLEAKLKSLDFNSKEFDKEIEKLRRDISKLENDLYKFEDEYAKVKNEISRRIESTVDDYLPVIGTAISKEEPISDLLIEMIEHIRCSVETGVKKLQLIDVPGINIAEMLKKKLERSGEQVKRIADLIADISTAALLFGVAGGFQAISGPAGAAGGAAEGGGAVGTVAAQKTAALGKTATTAAKVTKTAKALKALAVVGKIIKEINPVEKVKDIIVPIILDAKLRGKMKQGILERFNDVFDAIKVGIDEMIFEQYELPIREKKEAIENVREKIETGEEDTAKQREMTEADINNLKNI